MICCHVGQLVPAINLSDRGWSLMGKVRVVNRSVGIYNREVEISYVYGYVYVSR